MTEDKKPQAKITHRDRLYDGFFKIDELTIEMDRHEGGTQTVKRINFERGHAVGILAYDPKRDEVVLVNEMRPGMLAAAENPFNDSLAAGMIDKGENEIQAATRETEEETGLDLQNAKTIHKGAYVSAGGTSERIALVMGTVDTTRAGGVHGEPGEGENIKTFVVSAGEFIARGQDGRLKDMKSLVFSFWLALHRDELKDKDAPAVEHPVDVRRTMNAEITARKTLYDGVFKIENLTIDMDKHEGGRQTLQRLNFERGNSVAVLGYDPKRDEVVLVNEMRTGMLAAGDYPYSDTVPAAMLGKGEDIVTAAVNRMDRETGVKLENPVVIHDGAFVSAGGSSEKIALVAGIVDSSTAGGIHGRKEKGENIKTVVLTSDAFIARAENGELSDMKSLAFAFWLAQHRDALKKAAAPELKPIQPPKP